MVITNKSLKYYLNSPWTYLIKTNKDENGNEIVIVSVNELPGIKTDVPTFDQAMEKIKEIMEAAFELYKEMGKPIPEPIDKKDAREIFHIEPTASGIICWLKNLKKETYRSIKLLMKL